MPENKDGVRKVTLFLSSTNHELLKELAKRKRVTLGNIYDQATTAFLKLPANYMSMKRAGQLRKAQ
jgi:hypothetical protein